MKLNKVDKIVISIVGLILVLAIICGIVEYLLKKNKHNSLHIITFNHYEQKQLPEKIQKLSKTYNAFTELFNSDERVFTYGYEPLSIVKNHDQKFHNQLSQRIKEENINFKILPYPDWKEAELEIKENNGIDASCTMKNPEHEDLNTVLDVVDECFMNACIIDSKNGTYTVISRDINYLIKVLKNDGKYVDEFNISK